MKINGYEIKPGANLVNANLEGANLWNANLEDANLRGAKLLNANLVNANLEGADFRDANLVNANLEGADLWNANLKDANLVNANLRNANLWGANLVGANLRGADLEGADFWDANLVNADLNGANLVNANITGTILEKKEDDKDLEKESNHYFEGDYFYFELPKEIVYKYLDEKKLLKECRQTGRTTATTKKVLKTVFSQMKETDTSKVLIEGDTATIMGVKYKRVEEPKPETLYEALDEVYYGTTYVRREEICDVVERWLPDKIEYEDDEEYEIGWNEAIQAIKDKLR